jgi:predicted neutral ceramidase superfamily lipid hydrolase
MSLKAVKALFLIASIYDVVAGLAFALLYKPIYERFGVELPNHPGYVQLMGAFVLIFGIGFYLVSVDPVKNVSLILMGILMKAAFVIVVFYHSVFGSSPQLFVPFAVADLVFFLLFLWAYSGVRRGVAGPT